MNRSGPQLGGFLLSSDPDLVRVVGHWVDQGFAGNELKILDNHAGAPITEQRQRCETGLLVFYLAI